MSEQNREVLVIIRALEDRVAYLERNVRDSTQGGKVPVDAVYFGRLCEAEDQLENIRIMANAAEGMAGRDNDDDTGSNLVDSWTAH